MYFDSGKSVNLILCIKQLLRLGVNLKNFPTSAIPATFGILFHVGIAAVLLLYVLFWLKVCRWFVFTVTFRKVPIYITFPMIWTIPFLSSIFFTCTLIKLFKRLVCLLVCSHVQLDLFTTLKWVGLLGVFLLFVGHRILSHQASTSAKLKSAWKRPKKLEEISRLEKSKGCWAWKEIPERWGDFPLERETEGGTF